LTNSWRSGFRRSRAPIFSIYWLKVTLHAQVNRSAKASTAVKVGMVVEVVLRPTEQARSFQPEAMNLDIVL
jgi:hypothetical protein